MFEQAEPNVHLARARHQSNERAQALPQIVGGRLVTSSRKRMSVEVSIRANLARQLVWHDVGWNPVQVEGRREADAYVRVNVDEAPKVPVGTAAENDLLAHGLDKTRQLLDT